MTRIGPTISAGERLLLKQLAAANNEITLASARIASGHKINSPHDNPAAFLELSRLQNEQSLVRGATANVASASTMVSRAQLAIDQIRSQLDAIREQAVADVDQALTPDQRAAHQAAIDQAITAISQIVGQDIDGRQLLGEGADYIYSGVDPNQIIDIQAYSLGNAPSQSIAGGVISTASTAQASYTGMGGVATATANITVTGDRGGANISVTIGQSLTSLRDAINNESHVTGVVASVASDTLSFQSIAYGGQATIGIAATSGVFAVTGLGADGAAHGVDAVATINGQVVIGNGNRFEIQSGTLSASVEFAAGFTGMFSTVEISGEALSFNLSTSISDRAVLAIPGLQPARLGGLSGNLSQLATGGAKAGLGAGASAAVRIVDEALGKLTRVEGLVDGFANATIAASAALFDGFDEKLQDAIDQIDEVDIAAENAIISRNQLLADSAVAGIAILNEQRRGILALIQQAARLSTS
jgi:flagellin